ncbi:GAF domain-containing protein [Trichocoleus sp. ST-U3]|uniref:GAF domain-containing protein n=1 Tax=Coleofasciculus sp. FACHB-542 TaxID=2692787 RepID=UPI00168897D2|nr:GAF domain-containing protein [Coleofasciculus sp. FACHB-542]
MSKTISQSQKIPYPEERVSTRLYAKTSPMYCSNLLQSVAEATHQLLTNRDFAVGVNQALATLGRVTGVHRSYIFEIHPHPETRELAFSHRFEWTKEFVTPQIHNPNLQNQALAACRISRWYEDLQAGKAVRGLIRELSNGEREVLANKQISSILVVPISCNGKLWGLIGFDDRRYDRQWSKDEEACLITMAASFGKAIAHQQTTETLRQSELRLQQITANVPGMIFQFLQRSDGSQAVPYASSGCRELFELEPEAIQANCGKELIYPDDREAYEQSIAVSAVTQQPCKWEGRIQTPSGKIKWIQCASRPEKQLNGDILWDGLVMDITDRKRAEEALRSSEEKFASAFRSSPDSITITTLKEGRYIDVNESFLNLSGFQRHEIIGHTTLELNIWVNPEDRIKVIQQVQEEGAVRNQECEFRNKSGKVIIGLFCAEIINLEGEPCLLTIGNDITERKQAEMRQRLVQERDRLLAEMALRIRKSLDLDEIFNTTVAEVRSFLKADRVFIASDTTGKGRVMAESVEPNYPPIMNWVLDDRSSLEEMRTLFEANQVRVVEDTTQAMVHPAIASYYRDYHVKAAVAVPIRVKGDRLLGALIVNQCSGARRWEPIEIDLLEQLGTQVAIAIQQSCLFQQVQELNTNLECQVRERTAQLEQKIQEVQELYELKDVFLHAVSHDLRTPLTGWLLVLQNLLTANGNEQKTIPVSRSILERMIQSSDRQLRLINSLLEVHTSEVRGFVLQREPVQLNSLIQEIVEDFEPLCVKNQAILIDQIPSELPTVNADPLQLRRVFENLLTNAFNHNPPGLRMILRATVEEQTIRCTIEDNGVGMNPEQCDRAFELYARGSQARRSTGIGLGLYLCQQIVQAHGGKIGVTSSPKAGATFWFTLPFAMSP